jgi:lysine 2,3-aminomutase
MHHFQEKITSYLRELSKKSSAVRDMYCYNPNLENISIDKTKDIMLEKRNTQSKGLIHKYGNRVLIMLSYTCAANCRYCERQDRVGIGIDEEGMLTEQDIDNIYNYVEHHTDINEVIFSGGDPLTNPKILHYACLCLSKIKHIEVFRLHTKFPINNPFAVNFDLLEEIIELKPVFYLSIHVNHPDELNEISIPVIKKIRKLGFIMLSQSVFLKNINDDISVLERLFTILSQIGVRPYYIYHCTNIPTNKHFVVSIEEEISIMTELRNRLSGIAYPTHIIDLMNATGKITVPTNHWITNGNIIGICDFNGKILDFDSYY